MLTGTLQMMGYDFFYTFNEERLFSAPKIKELDNIVLIGL